MQKRLFIGISVPDGEKKRIFRLIEKEFKNLPVKWVERSNFHLTLNFLGYTQEERIPELCADISSALPGTSPFEISFGKVCFGPNRLNKKMIWLAGERSDDLENVKRKIDSELGFFEREHHKFLPHINLGRIKRGAWQSLDPEPDIEKDFDFNLSVGSIELFESRFEKGKRVYYVMESFPLN